jgi:hypothetical protein
MRPARLAGLALPIACLALAFALLSGPASERAAAAPCPNPTFTNSAGTLTIKGTAPCDDDAERFSVFCQAGTVRFDYEVNSVPLGPFDTLAVCGTVTRISVLGLGGGDVIDLSRVQAATGFTAVTSNMLEGGPGADQITGSSLPDVALGGSQSDILLLRDGVTDTADCGDGVDAVQADRRSLDTLANCEVADVLPEPVVAPTPKKNCKKIKSRAKRRKCRKHNASL